MKKKRIEIWPGLHASLNYKLWCAIEDLYWVDHKISMEERDIAHKIIQMLNLEKIEKEIGFSATGR